MMNAWADAKAGGARRRSELRPWIIASPLVRQAGPAGTAVERGGIAALNPRFRRLQVRKPRFYAAPSRAAGPAAGGQLRVCG